MVQSDIPCNCPMYLPRSIIIKTKLGEAPENIPTMIDVRRGLQEPSFGIDGGTIDRILHQFAGHVRICRVHAAACPNGIGRGHLGYNDTEQMFGLSRTFRVDFENPCCVSEVLDALRQAQRVESTSACYLCATEPSGNEQVEPDLALARQQRDAIRSREALVMEPGNPALTVAVLDTGVASGHPELWRQVGPGFDTVQLTARDLGGEIELIGDLKDPDCAPEDELGHGTSCVGIIAAKGKQIPQGMGGLSGIMAVRVLGSARVPGKDHPIGVGTNVDIETGIVQAINLGAKVINMSLGTPVESVMKGDRPYKDAVNYGLTRGCIFVAASGNSGKLEEYTPGCLPGVITVGSVGADGEPSAFTTSGPHVDLCAPGVDIFTTGLEGYSRQSGTSFAAPFVSGAAALLVSRAMRNSIPLDASAVRRFLVESARPNSSFDISKYGSGILDAFGALQALDQWVTQQQRQREYETLIV